MSKAVKCDIFYVDDSCLVCQHTDINEIEKQLNASFSNIYDFSNVYFFNIWFMDNKVNIYFGEDKTK